MNSTSKTNESQSLRRVTQRIIDDFLKKGKEKKKKKVVKKKRRAKKKQQERKRRELKKKETRVRNTFTTYVVLDTSVLSVRVQWPPFPPTPTPSSRHSFLSICIRKLSRRKLRFSSVPFLSFSIDRRTKILIIIKKKLSFLDHKRSNDPTYPSSFPNSHLVWLFICLLFVIFSLLIYFVFFFFTFIFFVFNIFILPFLIFLSYGSTEDEILQILQILQFSSNFFNFPFDLSPSLFYY